MSFYKLSIKRCCPRVEHCPTQAIDMLLLLWWSIRQTFFLWLFSHLNTVFVSKIKVVWFSRLFTDVCEEVSESICSHIHWLESAHFMFTTVVRLNVNVLTGQWMTRAVAGDAAVAYTFLSNSINASLSWRQMIAIQMYIANNKSSFNRSCCFSYIWCKRIH